MFPKLKIKLKGFHLADVVEIQEAVTNELKKVQKEEFSAALQKAYDRAKSVYMPMELILNKKKSVSLMCLRFKKKFLKRLDRTVYSSRMQEEISKLYNALIHKNGTKCVT